MDTENKKSHGTREQIISLIASAQNGSDEAFRELQSKYSPLIESQVRKYTTEYMSEQDREDLRQEAIVSFFCAVSNYDCSEENVEFGLYAKICIGNGLITFIRSYNRTKRCDIIPFDAVGGMVSGADEASDPAKQIVDEENAQMLIRKIQSNLSEYEASVWWLYTSGYSAKDIAKRLKRDDARSIENAIYRIRKKLRRVLSD